MGRERASEDRLEGRAGRPREAWRLRVAAAVTVRLGRDRERGDVPGWVLVTLMTAGLVTALWLIAEPALSRVFDEAIANVIP